MKRAAVYIRVSTEEQAEGHSLDFQRDDCLAQAIGDGFAVLPIHIYVDEGFSAKTAMDRPAFQRMIADAKGQPPPIRPRLRVEMGPFQPI